jgi:phosphopantothenoylcysteine decarboxylase/phosphopantothenate--cysteine ligase
MGRADDLLTNLVLASSAIKVLIPAMHPNMWNNAATVANIALLQERGFHVMRPATGRLTGTDSGVGRLPGTSEILAFLATIIADTQDLLGKRVLITAGGTREPIDPVRYIGNRSSGKQGYAVAQVALDRGADVTILSANVNLPDPVGATVVRVESALDLEMELERHFQSTDLLVMAAAVADFRPVPIADGKWKKEDGVPPIILEATPDILAGLGKMKRSGQILVGFAAETSNLLANAQGKLERKNLDLIVANDVSLPQVGFGHETNAVVIISANDAPMTVELASKTTIAQRILDSVEKSLHRIQEHT